MANAQLQFFDLSVSISPPGGHLEPLPVLLGPNWQPNDVRIMFASASAVKNSTALPISMNPDPPSGFSTAYSRDPGDDTHGVYFRRLSPGDVDSSVYWTKPSSWQHFMLAFLTVRAVSLTANPTGGSVNVSYTTGDSTGTSASASSVAVPNAGTMIFFVGNVASPERVSWPRWPVAVGVPTGWTHLVATEKSGQSFYQYDTNPSLVVVGKSFSGSGSTGAVVFPTAHGAPAFAGLYAFITPAPDVTGVIAAA